MSQPSSRVRAVRQCLQSFDITEGAGVAVRRSIGSQQLKNLDPFLLLDHFRSEDPDDYVAGFPAHPHRGFVTLTYMLEGHMEHRDSMGHCGDLRSGGAQWMRAASGIIHSEMPRQTNGLMCGFQLWLNLPASEKMGMPGYQDFQPESIPEIEWDGARVRLLAGRLGEQEGVIDDPHTGLYFFDVRLPAGARFASELPARHRAFAFVYDGGLIVSGQPMGCDTLGVLGDGDRFEAQAQGGGARFVLAAARTLGEPIVQGGPFVMNTREEIEQAFDDFRAGRLVREPHPDCRS